VAVAATGTAAPRVSAVCSVLGIFTNPRGVCQQHLMHVPAPLCVLVCGLAFGVFYLQTPLDISQGGWRGVVYVLGLSVLGLAETSTEDLDDLDKHNTIEHNEATVELLKDLGIGLTGNFVVDSQWTEEES